VLDDLLDLPPKWNNLVNYLEGEISKLAIVNIRPLVESLSLAKICNNPICPLLYKTPMVISGY
jgi:hypothetical protein